MSLDTVKKIVKALDDKKGNDIEVIKIDEYSGYLQNDTAYSSHTGLSLKADSGRAEFI